MSLWFAVASQCDNIPLWNKLLTIAQPLASQNGHAIESFRKRATKKGDMYFAHCVVCSANVKISCSIHGYKRVGTAFSTKCMPG